MATEDLTTYTEVDPGADISTTAAKVTITGIQSRNVSAYLYDDKGASHFSGDFTHLLESAFSNAANLSLLVPWSLANLVDDAKGIQDASGDALRTRFYNAAGTISLLLQELDGGTPYSATSYTVSAGTRYYFTIDRDESVGSFGQIRQRIYSDSGRTTLLNTQTVSLHTSKKDYRYIYATSTYDSTISGATCDGYTENLDLQEAAANKVGPLINGGLINTGLNAGRLVA